MDGREFVISSGSVAARSYGSEEGREDCLQVRCTKGRNVNRSIGGGTGHVNLVRAKIHERVVNDLRLSIPQLHLQLAEIKERMERLWRSVNQHSQMYCSRLGIGPKSMDRVDDFAETRRFCVIDGKEMHYTSFLDITVGGKKVALSVSNVAGRLYGGEWQKLVMAFFLDDSPFSESMGGGTMHIEVLSDEWHERVVEALTDGVRQTFHRDLQSRYEKEMAFFKYAYEASFAYNELFKRLPETVRKVLYKCLNTRAGVYPTAKERTKASILKIAVDGEVFGLHRISTACSKFVGDWVDLVQVTCISNPQLTMSLEEGTALICTVPFEWHRKILAKILQALKSQSLRQLFPSDYALESQELEAINAAHLALEDGMQEMMEESPATFVEAMLEAADDADEDTD